MIIGFLICNNILCVNYTNTEKYVFFLVKVIVVLSYGCNLKVYEFTGFHIDVSFNKNNLIFIYLVKRLLIG